MATRVQSDDTSQTAATETGARPGFWRGVIEWFNVFRRKRLPARRGPRGLMPTPPQVAELVERELKAAGVPVSDRERQRITDIFNLQFYFRGEPVAYRRTPQGLEVLAAGRQEVDELYAKLSQAERQGIILEHPGL
jgi:hypothetical protein